ncbi:DUF1016 N-terminal domain-containing protein [Pedobacter africanus]|uniref:YhcG N-terminal domain-containing protein n=1 Tax=Pedobacter africanus TaxID=151894 RepID=A0A1W2AYZ2_9SPHI|nr:DUF1016 N-terminal domain-containing protein [Pedobacter africanus]SMC65929.1 conserved hypothetical protein (putative transposase or invertase) [Pedobacter africanus]
MTLNTTILSDIKTTIHSAREKAGHAVEAEQVLMYWRIGQRIFLEEQKSEGHAESLIKMLSEQLQPEFGSGYSISQINLYLQFYRCFPIVHVLPAQLSWDHYKLLLGVEDQSGRDFYIVEAVKNNWSAGQLERKIAGKLFEHMSAITKEEYSIEQIMEQHEKQVPGISEEFIARLSAENPIFKKVFERLNYDNATEEERELYHSDLKAKSDWNAGIRYAEKKGKLEEKLEIAQKMKDKGLSLDEIKELTRFPIEEIEKF